MVPPVQLIRNLAVSCCRNYPAAPLGTSACGYGTETVGTGQEKATSLHLTWKAFPGPFFSIHTIYYIATMDQKIQFLWFSLSLTDLHYYNLSVWEYIYIICLKLSMYLVLISARTILSSSSRRTAIWVGLAGLKWRENSYSIASLGNYQSSKSALMNCSMLYSVPQWAALT